MALYHLTVSQIRRSAGQSAIAAAAYRAGECLYSDYYGEYSDYTRKGGVICSEILLPPHAPLEYQDRATLWNTVEQVEKHKKAQLAYSFDIALQNELSMEENIALAREFVQRCLVDKGMVADFAVHAPDKEDGGIPNPHFHVMTTMRPINPDGTWGQKQRREYVLDDEETGCWIGTASPCSTPYPLPTGAARKRWKNGGKHGAGWSMKSLRKRGWMFVLTTAPMCGRGLT